MPHITLEYSSNIIEKEGEFKNLFSKIHQLLVTKFKANIADCKSRSLKFDDFYLSEGDQNNSFIYLDIKILPGRSQKIIKSFSEDLLKILQDYFANSLKKQDLGISINIVEMQNYFKI